MLKQNTCTYLGAPGTLQGPGLSAAGLASRQRRSLEEGARDSGTERQHIHLSWFKGCLRLSTVIARGAADSVLDS